MSNSNLRSIVPMSEDDIAPVPPSRDPDMPPEIAYAVTQIMRRIAPIAKRGKNTEHGYKFVEMGDLLTEIQPMMAEAGLFVLQFEGAPRFVDEMVAITYHFRLVHQNGVSWEDEKLKQTGMCRYIWSSGKHDDKALNKCHTTARKYFLMALFQIPSGNIEDSDREGDDRRTGYREPAYDGVLYQETSRPPATAESFVVTGPDEMQELARRWVVTAKRMIDIAAEGQALKRWHTTNAETLEKLSRTDGGLYRELKDYYTNHLRALGTEPDFDDEIPF